MPSITTDYAKGTGDPSPYLRRIADAGFSHVHWCHQWNTDFLYSRYEQDQVKTWLREYGLALLDLHGSIGQEKKWASPREYERLSGAELVRNRIEMASFLGGNVVIMHTGLSDCPEGLVERDERLVPLRRSLDEIEPYARERGVRIAFENEGSGSWALLDRILGAYDPDYIGICYDSGHGNMHSDGLSRLASTADRLISVHLHDNDGTGDQHRLPFRGTTDWTKLAGILVSSSYAKCVSTEAMMSNEPTDGEDEFLAGAFEACSRLSAMVADARNSRCST